MKYLGLLLLALTACPKHNERKAIETPSKHDAAPPVVAVADAAAAVTLPPSPPVPDVPGMAQGAIQGAHYATDRIKDMVKGIDDPANRKPFNYFDKGSMATISRFSAKLGLYCGEVVEISQPLLPIGMNTPISMGPAFRRHSGRITFHHARRNR